MPFDQSVDTAGVLGNLVAEAPAAERSQPPRWPPRLLCLRGLRILHPGGRRLDPLRCLDDAVTRQVRAAYRLFAAASQITAIESGILHRLEHHLGDHAARAQDPLRRGAEAVVTDESGNGRLGAVRVQIPQTHRLHRCSGVHRRLEERGSHGAVGAAAPCGALGEDRDPIPRRQAVTEARHHAR